MRALSWTALSMMDGATVIVHDDEYDAYDQECVVHTHLIQIPNPLNKKKTKTVIDEITFDNDEFYFKYTVANGCENGKFRVFSKD